ncbi:hypothetical protein ABT354_22045 [Streptomyces sp. NPDC000594]|uniref:hypothetical protein n=1 Tax=Streptomyces sp. NPDC000594 TaxID=3154261 RepID=UPI003323FA99
MEPHTSPILSCHPRPRRATGAVAVVPTVPTGPPAAGGVPARGAAAGARRAGAAHRVTGDGPGGEPEILAAVARRTLGGSRCHPGIPGLDQGRRRSDGRRAVEGTVTVPAGRYPRLAPEADGPEVRYGPLPLPESFPGAARPAAARGVPDGPGALLTEGDPLLLGAVAVRPRTRRAARRERGAAGS